MAPATLDRPVRIVYDGTFNSMDGEVTLTADDIDAIAANHNAKIDNILANGGTLKENDCPPLQLDHSESARDTIGRVWGKLEAKDAEIKGVGIQRCLFGVARFIGPENTQPASDGRFSSVSIGIDLDNKVLDELSIVPFPAAPHAALLSRGKRLMKPEHLKHFLTSCKGMSEDDALRHLGGLDDDGKEKLGEEAKEHLKKLGAEFPDPEKKEGGEGGKLSEEDEKEKLAADEKEEKEKLARASEETEEEEKKEKEKLARGAKKQTALAKAQEGLRLARIELRRGEVKSRLSRLRAEAKITPAEEKNLEEKRFGSKKLALHELDEVAIDAIIGVMEAREPVIHTGHFGSMRGVDLASMGSEMKKARLAEQEAETLSNMPFTRQALANTRLAEGEANTQLAATKETGKVVRLMVADHMDLAGDPQTVVDETARRADAEADLAGRKVLSEQINNLSALVSELGSTTV